MGVTDQSSQVCTLKFLSKYGLYVNNWLGAACFYLSKKIKIIKKNCQITLTPTRLLYCVKMAAIRDPCRLILFTNKLSLWK